MQNGRHFWLLAVLAAALAVLQVLASAAEGAQHPAVVRVVAQHCDGRSCSRTYGSGTVVDIDGAAAVIVTCAHLFREPASSVAVRFPDGVTLAAEVKAIDQTWDLAALTIQADRQFGVAPVAISGVAPKPGDPLQSCGYGSDGEYSCNRGRAIGYGRTATTSSHETLELSGMARDGDSGGPVFNAQGELVAVLWGTNGQIVSATYCCRVQRFLAGLFPRLRDRFNRPTQPERAQPAGPLVPVQPTQPAPGAVEVIGGLAEPTGPGNSQNTPVDPAPDNPPAPNCPAGTFPGLEEMRHGLAGISKRLAAIEAGQEQAGGEASTERNKLAKALEAIGRLRDRVDAAKAAGAEDVRQIAKDVALRAARERVVQLLPASALGVLAALGFTGGSGCVAIAAWKLAGFVIRRRRSTKKGPARKEEPAASGGFCGSVPRDATEAAQILQLAKSEGRDPLLDGLVGRLTLDRLDNLVDAGGCDADWAASFRRELMDRINQIAPVAL